MNYICITLTAIIIALCVLILFLLEKIGRMEDSVVELHDKLPESYETEGYRYIGMRFQTEIKPYITIDEANKRIYLKVVKPGKK